MAENAPSRLRRSGWATPHADTGGRAARHARQCAGFTLLELLIAVTVLGLLMVLVVNGVQFGTRVWETGRASAARMGEAETARSFLRGWIESSHPFPVVDAADGSRRQIVLGGGPDRMRLPALMPAHLGGGRRLLELAVVGDGASRDLVLRSVSAEVNVGTEMVTVLVADVAAVRFDYFGPDGDDGLSWQPVWRAQDGAPLLVRVAVSFPAGDRRRWHPVIAAPMVDGAE